MTEKKQKTPDYRDYVIRDGKFIGEFEKMYQDVDDPWHIGDARDIQYDLVLFLMDRYRILPRSVLDIGCGKGAFSARIKKSRPDSEIIGIDISRTAITRAKERYAPLAGLDFAVLDIDHDIAMVTGRYDLVIMSQVIWYILPHFTAIIDRLVRENLADGGYLIINQAFYKPGQQTYGKEILSTVEEMIRLIGREPLEVIETNRQSNHNAVILYRKA